MQAVDDIERESEAAPEEDVAWIEYPNVLPGYVQELLSRVDQAVRQATKQVLVELLLRHEAALSQWESDLECATAV